MMRNTIIRAHKTYSSEDMGEYNFEVCCIVCPQGTMLKKFEVLKCYTEKIEKAYADLLGEPTKDDKLMRFIKYVAVRLQSSLVIPVPHGVRPALLKQAIEQVVPEFQGFVAAR